jgi:putative exosortase-associated protein (TIGR04073 family)
MKKLLIAILALFVFLSITTITYAKTPSEKLSRGIANLPGGLLEIPKNIDLEWKASKNAAVGIFAGLAKGLVMGVARIGSGLWDILSFPAALPKGYEPLLKPDLVFDKTK